jgi:hypothetical protein
VGVGKFIAQSFAGWPYAREGAAVKNEEAPLDDNLVGTAKETIAAIRHLEERVVAADGIVLRYGGFYGRGTTLAVGGEMVEAVRKRMFPVVGSGVGMASFIQIEDAARATVAAIERGEPGLYYIVDDDPAPVSEWLPYLADAVSTKPPRHLPRWLGRLMAGETLATMVTEGRGASNAKAKRKLGWQPLYPSWREGFVNGLGADTRRAAKGSARLEKAQDCEHAPAVGIRRREPQLLEVLATTDWSNQRSVSVRHMGVRGGGLRPTSLETRARTNFWLQTTRL